MKNLLNSVKIPTVKKSFFDMSFEHKTTLKMGDLVPISCTPVVPSDRVTIGIDSMMRFQPMLAPLMHLVNVYTHSFFVPYRLLWRGTTQNNRWNDYIANIKTLGVLPVVPYLPFSSGMADPGSLPNYLGIPSLLTANTNLAAFNFAAYQCIYNEYYRDQNLTDEVPYLLTDGNNSANLTELTTLRKRCWEKDYFTAALPWAQKGDAVNIPFNDVEVKHNWESDPPEAFTNLQAALPSTENPIVRQEQSPDVDIPGSGLYADMSGATTTINDLRLAYTLQRWYEQLARGGTRPNEFLKVMFNVNSKDARLQRPEYITGSKSPVMISEVLNTTGTAEAAQGAMAGHGVGVTKGKQGSFYVEEYGVVMTIMSVLPKTSYLQGIPKEYLKLTDPTEHYVPTFDHLGEQAVINKELYATHFDPDGTFGYVPRYCEYKYPKSYVTGDFQETLAYWHMARIFETAPELNHDFVTSDPTPRIFAVEFSEYSSLLASIWVDLKMVRPMSKFSTPTF